ncbi:Na+/H+ antiporter subunit E [Herbiconiux liukaitaii]|uniref:Na+/H+ antiporter subunit E n=1 Tax=Herbiconiux liukaitaii TaxID=3342799 RepID=UPI0035B93662
MSPRTRARLLRARIASGLVPFLGLVLLWMLLWGQFTWLALITGVALAFVVSAVFFLPAVRLSGRINPWRALVFLAKLLIDIVVASIQIAWVAVKPGYVASNAIIAVPLRTRSDLVMTFTAEAIALVPGSIVLDIDRENATLYLHSFDVTSLDELPARRRAVLATERRLILAAGSNDDLVRLRKSEDALAAGAEIETVPDPEAPYGVGTGAIDLTDDGTGAGTGTDTGTERGRS